MLTALRCALTATIHIIRMRARHMVFTVPAGFLTASSSEPVHGSAAGLEAVGSLADAILMADGALIVTVDSEVADLIIVAADSMAADR
jgi:hypothetical protein